MKITIPELSLVVLIGVSGAGKSTFARKHFLSTEILSSDYCRGLVSNDENNQDATTDAFEVLHFIAAKRLKAGLLTVIDATNVQPESRKPLIELAKKYHCLPVACVLDMPESLCQQRNRTRLDRSFGEHVIRTQRQHLNRSIKHLTREGFRHVHIVKSVEELEQLQIERQPLWNNKKYEHGPFDIIGDIHGCFEELCLLLTQLGYHLAYEDSIYKLTHPAGRKVVFVGDLVDRGPRSPDVIRLVMHAVQSGIGLCVAGNHDVKLVKALRGKNVTVAHGLQESLDQLSVESAGFLAEAIAFLDGLVSHYVLDNGKLVVAHAGLKESMHGRGSGRVREFAMYGETTGEIDSFGLPVRHNWAEDYRGDAMVVYGHTPVLHPEWLNNTLCIDTGCVFGGKLSALQYPEKNIISVPALREYYQPIRPLEQTSYALTQQHEADDLLDIADVSGKRIIHTRLCHAITIQEAQSSAALEVISRFATHPQWLIYLPATMSPSETSHETDLLEHPQEAFSYYKRQGITQVVCEEKHMGSRAIIIICKDEIVSKNRFGLIGEGRGIIYTRTGRRFFSDQHIEHAVLERLSESLHRANFWEKFESDWFCFDCELMPWSLKAQELIHTHYAAVGTASRNALSSIISLLNNTPLSDEIEKMRSEYASRAQLSKQYEEAYRRYCWPVNSIDDIKLAPFHFLATEGKTYFDKTHEWHMQTMHTLCQYDPAWLIATSYKVVNLANTIECEEAISWWQSLTTCGGEGMVIKPMDFISYGQRGLVQPAIKCRGAEYLRIIYGPEYSRQSNLIRLKERGLNKKRNLALKETALGIEALERFVKKEPLRKVHECIFGVLALESAPIDPRL